ncbi:protein amalgam isoform X2 [Bemisia tabaci]|uniref:protein amalgam isoform X2 n=1 Tax=Bemisia tabaci TaxID=7038 RepID=UPI0008F995C4|nr:PREDICTED: protein amalgam-like isoform X2 [Bemisia tabaci]
MESRKFANVSLTLVTVLLYGVRALAVAVAYNGKGVNSYESNIVTQAPSFTTTGQTFRVVIGDVLVLPCEVENLGNLVVLWRRGNSVLTAKNIMVTRDSRFRLVDGLNLEISAIMPQDAGDYVCQISDIENKVQTHTVEVLVPPSIRTTPLNGQLTARKGGTITLECKPSGNPVPSVFWSKKDSVLPSGERSVEGSTITLEKVDRHQAGIYQCTAENGIGKPATVDMTLDVLYPPEIEVEKSWVHSGEGYRAELVCLVHGEPDPTVTWYQDSFLVAPTERRYVETRGNKHILTIKELQPSDFGNYSCVADNSLGKNKKFMELSGRPSPAVFRSAPLGRSKDSFNLTWLVESYPPLEEVRLLYRKVLMNESYQHPSKWTDVSPPFENREPNTHLMSYNIQHLDPSSVYEALVQAKNRYGWNEVSEMFQFYTRAADFTEDQEMNELELVASWSTRIVPSLVPLSIILSILLST